MHYNTVYQNYLSTSANIVMSKMSPIARLPLERVGQGNAKLRQLHSARQSVAAFRDRMVARSVRQTNHNPRRQSLIDTTSDAYEDICRIIRSCGDCTV